MSVERTAANRLCLAAASAIVLATLPPTLHFDNTVRVITALLTNKTGCADGVRASNPNYPFDAIAVPGAGVSRMPDGSHIPTDDGQTRLRAAAIAFSAGVAPRIILLDGVEHPGTSETYLRIQFSQLTAGSEIPDKTILVDGNSTNTATNMKELRKIINEHRIGTVVMVTNKYHIPRSVLLACANGVATSPLAAEDLLPEESPRGINAAVPWKERVEVLFQLWDPKGEIQTLLGRLKNNF